jgi:hypothetical protein
MQDKHVYLHRVFSVTDIVWLYYGGRIRLLTSRPTFIYSQKASLTNSWRQKMTPTNSLKMLFFF